MITKLNYTDKTIKSYAIRKLTPRECFRLMGVREGVIDTMQSTTAKARERVSDWDGKGKDESMAISASQQYKQAGNSIVVDVLAAIYEQLWYPRHIESPCQASLMDGLFPEDSLPKCPPQSTDGKIFITTFSGYDSQLMAADALKEKHPDFKWTCKGWADIDKYACQMHNLVFPQYAKYALGDVTKIDWHKVKESLNGREVDMFTYSSPCQDISQSGKQLGLQEGSGTRSSLLWYVADAIDVLRPKYLLQENVAALVSKKFMPDFQKWLDRLEQLGYVNKWARLNAKYYVPQNRDRVFCLSMRKDVAFDFQFPQPTEVNRHLAEVLEDEVEGRYFLKDESVGKFLQANSESSELLVQFTLPPLHEDAMFLKTWLTLWMRNNEGWALPQGALFEKIEQAKDEFYTACRAWKEQGVVPQGEFADMFADNLRSDAQAV